jgi:hypothetical protein
MIHQRIAMPDKRFTGLWKLRKMEKIASNGSVCYPFGDNPLGYIFYTEDGFMFTILMKARRAPITVTLDELGHAKQTNQLWYRFKYLKALFKYLQAATTCVAYCGTYDVRGDYVIHQVRASLFPDWIGTDLERAFLFSEQTLTLTANYPGGDRLEVVWERT